MIRMKPILLDGSSGGGQMLRTALSLAMITRRPFRMVHIRGKRSRPGLMRQHLACVRAACEISGGTADGADIGSTEIVFRSHEIRPGSYQFAVGTAGSTSLILQTLLPALWLAGGESSVTVEGGTHNPLAPPFDFLDRVFLPAMAKLGATAGIHLLETGFAPAGGGAVRCDVLPCGGFQRADFTNRGALLGTKIRVPVRNLPQSIAGRVLDAAVAVCPCNDAAVELREPGPGRGLACLVEAEFEHTREMTCSFGEQGVGEDKVGRRAGKLMSDFIGCGTAVGRHLADQLLLPLALAGGGCFTTMAPDDHLSTNAAVIRSFLDITIDITELGHGQWEVRLGS
jgi:RNA 3'-terminal phosphate cyclase (ATP)